MTAIWGSRQKAKLALKRIQLTPKHDGQTHLTPKNDENHLALVTVPNEEVVDAKPLAVSGGMLRASGSKEPAARLHPLPYYYFLVELGYFYVCL